jgi:hypothetical protein
MAKRKSAFPRLTTKPGVAKWPHLVTPDTTFNKKGTYHVKLLWTPEEFDEMELKSVIDKLVKAGYDLNVKKENLEVFKQYPYDDDVDENKEETGKIAVKFKSNASFENKDGETIKLKPALFGPAGEAIRRRINIGNGSVLCINTTIKPYAMKDKMMVDGGVTLYINGVQIRELVEYGATAESMGFETDGEPLATGDDYEAGDEQAPADGEGDF